MASNPDHAGGSVGPQSVPGFITAFDPGPNESGQSVVQYVVTESVDPANIVEGVAISTAGTLSYTLNANADGGTASFDVVVRDSGGTANGGVDTSGVSNFSITMSSSVDVLFGNGFE